MAELAVITNTQGSTTSLSKGYTSITSSDMATKKRVYAAVTAAESLKDHLGVKITVVDVLAQVVEEVKPDGTVEEYTRITLLAADGKAYSASSTGVLNSLETAFKIFGEPSQWGEGLTFVAREVQSPNNKSWRFVTLDIAE